MKLLLLNSNSTQVVRDRLVACGYTTSHRGLYHLG